MQYSQTGACLISSDIFRFQLHVHPNAKVEWLAFVFRTQRVASSNPEGLSESSLTWFITVPPYEYRIRTLHQARVISNSKSLKHKTFKRSVNTYIFYDVFKRLRMVSTTEICLLTKLIKLC